MRKKDNRFTIDFFEFAFLVEACIPESSIVRAMFWDKTINHYYNILTEEEREKLFEWIQLNPNFDLSKKDCKVWYDRYNPDNQYIVTTIFDGKEQKYRCFITDSIMGIRGFATKKDTFIQDGYIINVEKINSSGPSDI